MQYEKAAEHAPRKFQPPLLFLAGFYKLQWLFKEVYTFISEHSLLFPDIYPKLHPLEDKVAAAFDFPSDENGSKAASLSEEILDGLLGAKNTLKVSLPLTEKL